MLFSWFVPPHGKETAFSLHASVNQPSKGSSCPLSHAPSIRPKSFRSLFFFTSQFRFIYGWTTSPLVRRPKSAPRGHISGALLVPHRPSARMDVVFLNLIQNILLPFV